jgi:hypothetical protein
LSSHGLPSSIFWEDRGSEISTKSLIYLAGATGLEPATSSVTGQRESNEINGRFNSQPDNSGHKETRFDLVGQKLKRGKNLHPKNHKRLGEPIGKRRKQERESKKRRSGVAAARPYWFASTAHPPATAASVATTANVTATPISIGSPLRMNGRPALAHTNDMS